MSEAKTTKSQGHGSPDGVAATALGQVAAGGPDAANPAQPARDLHDEVMGDRDLAAARQELAAIVDTSEIAVSAILDACEAIEQVSRAVPTGELRDCLLDATRNIYLACGFQDLTGQRAKKAIARLQAVDRKVTTVSAMLELAQGAMAPVSTESVDQLLNGPALPSDAMTQREIDRIMALLDAAVERKAKS